LVRRLPAFCVGRIGGFVARLASMCVDRWWWLGGAGRWVFGDVIDHRFGVVARFAGVGGSDSFGSGEEF